MPRYSSLDLPELPGTDLDRRSFIDRLIGTAWRAKGMAVSRPRNEASDEKLTPVMPEDAPQWLVDQARFIHPADETRAIAYVTLAMSLGLSPSPELREHMDERLGELREAVRDRQ